MRNADDSVFGSDISNNDRAQSNGLGGPYYADRFSPLAKARGSSVRARAASLDSDQQAERLFRDFKLGLITLVIIALLLLAYFWDGNDATGSRDAKRRGLLLMQFKAIPRKEAALIRISENRTGAIKEPIKFRPRVSAPPPKDKVKVVEYVVRRGDTLTEISHKFYGTSTKWKLILNANRKMLRRPNDLREGMKLHIPDVKSDGQRKLAANTMTR